jgi:hypothetical protein
VTRKLGVPWRGTKNWPPCCNRGGAWRALPLVLPACIITSRCWCHVTPCTAHPCLYRTETKRKAQLPDTVIPYGDSRGEGEKSVLDLLLSESDTIGLENLVGSPAYGYVSDYVWCTVYEGAYVRHGTLRAWAGDHFASLNSETNQPFSFLFLLLSDRHGLAILARCLGSRAPRI